ncbi:MAG TPA: GNAT family N-acetyltransferase [Caldisericia bacterium]|nr:GNAT family N-acetyltransferase [Caldisericia bacterium]HPF48734.1 GNAT family N-acetyltransferase [Caldisericia bacterium]HPI83606.1 GNAT family N-acetyltransferase [Caldisericia bacterium]HPQ93189.1 GNAT family N-acetyltransferase [Caldisericia bacterium]HRV74978.1 GNAT family N-acetyltransferase [Caldisericia bacterium]
MNLLSKHTNGSFSWEIYEAFPEDATDSLIRSYISLLKATNPDASKKYQNMDKADFIRNFWNTNWQEKGAIYRRFVAKTGSEILGFGRLSIDSLVIEGDDKDKRPIGLVGVTVFLEKRRQGIGKSILLEIIRISKSLGISAISVPVDNETACKICSSYGGKVSSVLVESRLYLKDLDSKALAKEIDSIKTKLPEIQFVFTYEMTDEQFGEYLDMITSFFAELSKQRDDEPFDEDAFRKTEIENRNKGVGDPKLVLFSVEKVGGASGFISVVLDKDKPEEGYIEFTGVKKQYRGRGIGASLKLLMHQFIKNDHKEIEYLRTLNYEHNVEIMKINRKFGYKTHSTTTKFVFELDSLARKLQAQNG